jgi:hypothetical protein
MAVTKVSLRQPRARAGGPADGSASGTPFLDPDGPFCLLGDRQASPESPLPLAPRADTLFGPRGVALGPPGAALAICDTGHHRLLLWRHIPEQDGVPADLILGQPDFVSEGRNARGEPTSLTLNVPTGVAIGRDVLAVADAWNHRVLLWHRIPVRSNTPPDVVLGQSSFGEGSPNRGSSAPDADTLHWCYGVTLAGDKLVVTDTGNRRCLIWNQLPTFHGQPADIVLGQPDFRSRDESAGGASPRSGMRWPHAASTLGSGLQIVDAGLSRILIWQSWPTVSSALPDLILGQADFTSTDPNQGAYWPAANTLNLPYGLAAADSWLVAADTANSRLLGWRPEGLRQGAPADGLAAQPDFAARGDNRWQLAARDSVCWPTCVAARRGMVAVADTGNNRVSLWRLSTEPAASPVATPTQTY